MDTFHKDVGTRHRKGVGRYGVIANVIADKVLRKGAKVYVLEVHWEGRTAVVHGISHGGRRVDKHVPLKRLQNFRAAWLPDHVVADNPNRTAACQLRFEQKEEAQRLSDEWAEMWRDIQWYDKDGVEQTRDGAPASEAFRRLEALLKDKM